MIAEKAKRTAKNLTNILVPGALTKSMLDKERPNDGLEAFNYNIELFSSIGLDLLKLTAYVTIGYHLLK